MDLLMTMGDIDSIDDSFAMDDATEMHENVTFVNEVPANVTVGIVCFDNRYRGDARPYKVIDSRTGRYLRGFASKEEALDFARNPHEYASRRSNTQVASHWRVIAA